MRKGQQIIRGGEQGRVTRTMNSANEGTPLVEYRRAEDGSIRVARRDEVLVIHPVPGNPNGSTYDVSMVGVD